MRHARVRCDDNPEGSYYHLINHTVGNWSDLPFGEVEKETFVALLKKLTAFYAIEVFGFCVMGNHFHLMIWVPHDLPDEAEALRRFTEAYPKEAPPTPGSPELLQLRRRMRDFSDFAKQLQMQFTSWFNRTRPSKRRGTLWVDRFKSLVVEGTREHAAVWNCLAYVEMNPVAAGMANDPSDYRFSSWGQACGSGKHPFQENFIRHLRRTMPAEFGELDDNAMEARFRAKLAAMTALEHGGDLEDAESAAEDAQADPDLLTRIRRRRRYWIDGVAIGGKAFVQKIRVRCFGGDPDAPPRFGRAETADGDVLYSMRRPSLAP